MPSPAHEQPLVEGVLVAMAELIYTAIKSVDGYVADEHGKCDWAEPHQEGHGFFNDVDRSVGTYLYGRRMYETIVLLETACAPFTSWVFREQRTNGDQSFRSLARIAMCAVRGVHVTIGERRSSPCD